jgi:predicted amidohydrolase YtcJ
MLHDFADPLPDLPRGKALLSVEQIATALSRCADHGLLLAAHAIGDGAVRACLDAAERTGLGRHLRIEHAEIVDAADVPRFAALGVTLSVQPCHLLADIEALRRSLPHRLDRVLPLRDVIKSGLIPGQTLLFGSDAPVVGADPRDSIQAATQRRRASMAVDEAIAPDQAIGEREAWACFGLA